MKRLLVILTILSGILCCKKEEVKGEEKLTLNCSLESCQNLSFSIGGETGSSRTFNLTTNYTYNSSGQREKATMSGTLTYTDTGHAYQIESVVYLLTCKYTLSITDQNGIKGSCGN